MINGRHNAKFNIYETICDALPIDFIIVRVSQHASTKTQLQYFIILEFQVLMPSEIIMKRKKQKKN